ncbi:nuclear transport factor 2 family protein [Xylanimonas ulmi]|uniref:SnoaL-like protein n=1 Tax=Xylanimonas ulmi TaxID=228973 RepID=A0A4Q7M826_9MICO|nr:nuclear transport factor 2 family protein [Xylanibacterium ulmi]RZS62289.1 hypothetical protein EV386_2617 [Xylanibacterium ulmi]
MSHDTTRPHPDVPASMRVFLDRHTGSPTPQLLDAFAEGAVVRDEGRTMTGRDAIEAWLRGTSTAYTYTITVTGHVVGHVYARLEGDFPGGVADLDFAYETDAAGRIARLVIS